MTNDEIKPVHRVYKDGGDYMVRCPHCEVWMILEGDDLSELRGEQFIHDSHRGCNGWLEISTTARYAGRMPDDE